MTPEGLRCSSATLLPAGAVLFTSRAPIGYVAIAANELATNQGFKSVVPYVDECGPFIAVYFRAFAKWIDSTAPGTTFREVSGKAVASLPFPLPPLAEQHRIVAKVDELMALCDRLEAAQTERESRRDRLVSASLQRLSQPAADPTAFRDHARFHLDGLPRLVTRLQHIAELRKVILDLAVSGRLVRCEPSDEPAANLIERVRSDAPQLAGTGLKRRRMRGLAAIAPGERLTTPSHWEQVRIGEVATLVTKGSTPTSYGHTFVAQGVNFIKVEAIVRGQLLSENVTSFISPATHEFMKRSRLEAGDILFSIAGSIGTCAVVRDEVLPANTNQALAIIRGTQRVFTPAFLLHSLRSSAAEPVRDRARGGAMSNVSLEDIRNLVLPLPPLAEQHRIVAKVDQLMTVCDQLEAAITTAQTERRHLLEALLHEALQPAA